MMCVGVLVGVYRTAHVEVRGQLWVLLPSALFAICLLLLTTVYVRLAGSQASDSSSIFASPIEKCWDYRCQ